MKITDSDKLKHRQLQIEDSLQKVSAEQKDYAEVCASPKIIETDITNTKCVSFGSAVYRTVRTVLWEVG